VSRTLFWYLFKDLIRIFLLAAVVIAGIMSFGGLLQPLTRNGLDASQVGWLLVYLMPAMTTYSLPIAALFATTIVYGRLSADNELTACRAAGISHLSIAAPATVLGLTVSITSLLFLCFIVPAFTLKVEQVAKSNIAQWVAHQIEASHRLSLGSDRPVVFAQHARVGEVDPEHPDDQCVILEGPTIVEEQTMPSAGKSDPRPLRVPEQFHMAQEATIYVRQIPERDQVTAEIVLEHGVSFPRDMKGKYQAGIESTRIGPITFPPPIKENTKFMNIFRLKQLQAYPGRSSKIRKSVDDFVRDEQIGQFAAMLVGGLRGPENRYVFGGGNEIYELSAPANVVAEMRGGKLRLESPGTRRQIRLTRRPLEGRPNLDVYAARASLRLSPDEASGRMAVSAVLEDALDEVDALAAPREQFPQYFTVSMPEDIRRIPQERTPDYYRTGPGAQLLDAKLLNAFSRDLLKVTNSIVSEMHGRVAFALSCLMLVMVGCALGMMLKSGNFLSAFAVSVLPALLGITLIGAGQQMAESLPEVVTGAGFRNTPLQLGLALTWSGNVAIAGIATTLLWRLQRR
jgi:lipopolysaccharide export LptBFGC system permease protein LptF